MSRFLKDRYPNLFKEIVIDEQINFNIEKLTYGSERKINWKCGKCDSVYLATPNNRTSNKRGCPYCSGQKVNHTNSLQSLRPNVASQWDYDMNDITPNDVTCGTTRKFWWKCELGHSHKVSVVDKVRGMNCYYCSNKKILIGFNDMYTTHPEIASLLWDKEDGYKNTYGVNKKLKFKCVKCGGLINSKPIKMIINHVTCLNCGFSKKLPEKMFINALNSSNVYFEYNKKFGWSNNKLYDFYIPSLNIIIELHGSQHKKVGYENIGGMTLKQQIINDKFKRELALENGIDNYYEIDVSYDDFGKIRDSILNSEICEILKITKDNFVFEFYDSNENIFKSWEMYNEGLSIKEISDELKIARNTVRKYLKIGSELNKCSYEVNN